jgi:hypothetical protein
VRVPPLPTLGAWPAFPAIVGACVPEHSRTSEAFATESVLEQWYQDVLDVGDGAENFRLLMCEGPPL